jgi:membrane-bound lytic murein transglycosylase
MTDPMTKGYIMEIISRKDALSQGRKRYFTGKPCPNGHVCERLVSSWTCVRCTRNNAIRWQKENKEKSNEIRQKSVQKNKENVSRKQKEWREKNPEYFRNWRSKNKTKVNEAAKKYRKNNREKVLACNAKRRAKLANSDGVYTDLDVEKILNMQGGKCPNCKTKITKNYHVDHIMPLALGGSNWPENIQCLCPTCNMRKHAKDPIDWARENGKLI